MDQPTHEHIAARAYQIWQERGSGHGAHEADWFQAEQELRTERDNPLASAAKKLGTAIGAAVAFLADPLDSLKS